MPSTPIDPGTPLHPREPVSTDEGSPVDTNERMQRICSHIITLLLDGISCNELLMELYNHTCMDTIDNHTV